MSKYMRKYMGGAGVGRQGEEILSDHQISPGTARGSEGKRGERGGGRQGRFFTGRGVACVILGGVWSGGGVWEGCGMVQEGCDRGRVYGMEGGCGWVGWGWEWEMGMGIV
mgnify:CR=1 FL=1